MSKPSWQKKLANSLTYLSPSNTTPRVAVIGIGNELSGDDAAGVLTVRSVSEQLEKRDNLLLLEGHSAPENLSKPIRQFKPDLLLIVDAVNSGGELHPGEVIWLEMDAVGGISALTHRMPPTVFAKFIQHETGCKIAILGIQVVQVDFDSPVSPEIAEAVKTVSEALLCELRELLKTLNSKKGLLEKCEQTFFFFNLHLSGISTKFAKTLVSVYPRLRKCPAPLKTSRTKFSLSSKLTGINPIQIAVDICIQFPSESINMVLCRGKKSHPDNHN